MRTTTNWNGPSQRLFVTLIVVVAAGVRFYRLGTQSLWYDECEMLGQWKAFHDFPLALQLEWLVRGWSLHNILMGGVWILLGTGEFILRLPSAAFGVLNVLVVYYLGATLFDRRVGLVAALLLALSPFHLWYSQDAKPYAMLMLLSTVSCLGLVYWLKRRTAAWWWAWLAATALAVLTFRPAIYLALFQGVFLALRWRTHGRGFLTRLKRPSMLLTGLLVAAAAVPWTVTSVQYLNRAVMSPESVFANLRPVPPMALPYTFFAFSAGFSVGPSVAQLHLQQPLHLLRPHAPEIAIFGIVFGALFVLGCKRLLPDRERLLFLGLYLVVPIVSMLVLALLTGHSYNARYASPALVPYLLIVARGLVPRQDHRTAGRPAVATALSLGALMLCAVLCGGAVYAYFFNPAYGKVDSRAAAGKISDGERPGDVILLSAYWEFDALSCYYQGELPVLPIDRRLPVPAIEEKLAAVLTSNARLWLVSGQPWASGQRGVFPPSLAAEYDVREQWEFSGVSVFLLEKSLQGTSGRDAEPGAP